MTSYLKVHFIINSNILAKVYSNTQQVTFIELPPRRKTFPTKYKCLLTFPSNLVTKRRSVFLNNLRFFAVKWQPATCNNKTI